MSKENNLVTIGYVYSEWEAACIRAGFDGAGLPVFIADQTLCRTHPQFAVALGGMRVQVRRGDAPAASDLLSPMVDQRARGRFRPVWAAFLIACFYLFGVPAHFGPGLYLRRPADQVAAQP